MLPCGIFNTSYKQEIAVFRTKTHWVLFVLFSIFVFTFPLYGSGYIMTIAPIIAITIVAVQGLNLLTGYCGQLSVGHSGFMGVGAYCFVLMSNNYHLSVPVGLFCSGLVAGMVGIIVGLPALRIKGFYLAMVTLAAQLVFGWIFLNWRGVTGGSEGLFLDSVEMFGLSFSSPVSKYYLVMSVAFVMVYFAKNLARSMVGRAFVAIRDNDLAAGVMGIDIVRYKLLAFFLACFFAGVAGGLWAIQMEFVSPMQFTLNLSILYLGMLIIGGMGSIMGPIFGVIFVKVLEEVALIVSPTVSELWPAIGAQASGALLFMLYAATILVFLIFQPRGINYRWTVFKNQYRVYPFSSL